MGLFSKSKSKQLKEKEPTRPSPGDSRDNLDNILSPPGPILESPNHRKVIEDPLSEGPRTGDILRGTRSPTLSDTPKITEGDNTYAGSSHGGGAGRSSPSSVLSKDKSDVTEDDMQKEKNASSATKAKKRGCFGKSGDYFSSRISLKSIWQLINPVDYFWPITLRKYLCLALIAASALASTFPTSTPTGSASP